LLKNDGIKREKIKWLDRRETIRFYAADFLSEGSRE